MRLRCFYACLDGHHQFCAIVTSEKYFALSIFCLAVAPLLVLAHICLSSPEWSMVSDGEHLCCDEGLSSSAQFASQQHSIYKFAP